ncbi:MAG TPA: DoxX family protein [Terriglobales bacterium]|nr:DoxX family protein [Terriglobales bacterium]
MSNGRNESSWGLTILRVVVGLAFLLHGWQKLFVMHVSGVGGFLGSLGVPVPGLAAWVLTLVEFLGGAALILGLFTRWVAWLLAVDMVMAMLLVHAKHGFFYPGVEYALTLMAANIALALTGPGAASVDGVLAKKGKAGQI